MGQPCCNEQGQFNLANLNGIVLVLPARNPDLSLGQSRGVLPRLAAAAPQTPAQGCSSPCLAGA